MSSGRGSGLSDFSRLTLDPDSQERERLRFPEILFLRSFFFFRSFDEVSRKRDELVEALGSGSSGPPSQSKVLGDWVGLLLIATGSPLEAAADDEEAACLPSTSMASKNLPVRGDGVGWSTLGYPRDEVGGVA